MYKFGQSVLDAINRLDEAMVKAKSLSLVAYGEAGEAFRGLNDEDQDIILWILGGLISEADEAKTALYSAIRNFAEVAVDGQEGASDA